MRSRCSDVRPRPLLFLVTVGRGNGRESMVPIQPHLEEDNGQLRPYAGDRCGYDGTVGR